MATNSSRGPAWNALRQQVLIRDNYTCNYCGNEANEADHVLPKARGGKDEINNLVAACRRCNGAKQDRIDARMNWFNNHWLEGL